MLSHPQLATALSLSIVCGGLTAVGPFLAMCIVADALTSKCRQLLPRLGRWLCCKRRLGAARGSVTVAVGASAHRLFGAASASSMGSARSLVVRLPVHD